MRIERRIGKLISQFVSQVRGDVVFHAFRRRVKMVDGQFKVYPFEELEKGQARFADEFQGKSFDVLFDEENKTARVVGADGLEIPTTIAFWFAWYAFHPESDVFTADSKK